MSRCYLEHAAIRVRDIAWHLRFFREALGMPVRALEGPAEAPAQAWTVGGVQLISDPGFQGGEGRLGHLGVMAEDLEVVLARAKAFGVQPHPKGPGWFTLPDGLVIEVMQAAGRSVAQALAVDARAPAR